MFSGEHPPPRRSLEQYRAPVTRSQSATSRGSSSMDDTSTDSPDPASSGPSRDVSSMKKLDVTRARQGGVPSLFDGLPLPTSESAGVDNDSSSSSNRTTIPVTRPGLNLAGLPVYDGGVRHPLPSEWQTLHDFEDFVRTTPHASTSLYAFLQDLVPAYRKALLRAPVTRASPVPTKESPEYIRLKESYEELKTSVNDLAEENENLAGGVKLLQEKVARKERSVQSWKGGYQSLLTEVESLEREMASLQQKLATKPSAARPIIDISDDEDLAPQRSRETRPPTTHAPDRFATRPGNDLTFTPGRENTPLRRDDSVATHFNLPPGFKKSGSNPTEKFSGADPDKYVPWKFAVESKLDVDAPLFPTEKRKIEYALRFIDTPLFTPMQDWFVYETKEGRPPSIDDFFREIEFHTGASDLAERARSELLSIRQRGDEPVSQFHTRLLGLWSRAGYSESERLRSFINSLRPALSRHILPLSFNRTVEALTTLRNVERNTLSIETHQHRPQTSRQQQPAFAARSGTPRNTPRPAASASATYASGDPKPTASKPAGWSGTWYEPERSPEKLDLAGRAKLAAQERCFRCRGSGHRASDAVCPNHANANRPVRVNLIELNSSDSSSDNELLLSTKQELKAKT